MAADEDDGDIEAVPVTETTLGWIARWLSAVGSPYVIGPIVILAILLAAPGTWPEKAVWGTLAIVVPMSGTMLYTLWMIKKGLISDLHIAEREHRGRVFLVSAIFGGISYWLLSVTGAPFLIQALGRVYLVNCGLMALVTRGWKISIHASFLACATVLVYRAFGDPPAIGMGVLTLIVMWSRTYRGRHTPAQVLVGACLAAIMTWMATNPGAPTPALPWPLGGF